MNTDIYFFCPENEQEKLFKRKCSRLLEFYSIDKILEENSTFINFSNTFENDYLTNANINHILVKNYYLNHNANDRLNTYLVNNNLSEIDELLNTNIRVKKELLKSYLQNIKHNHFNLIREKLYDTPYQKIINTLVNIENFYNIKKENEIYTYKKSYKINL